MFYKARGKVIKLFDDYTKILSIPKNGVTNEKRIKILNPKVIDLKTYQMESAKSKIYYIKQKRKKKKKKKKMTEKVYQQYNEFNEIIKQNEFYVYEFQKW